ncbi:MULTISPECIES: mechanosensitive ion channel family protein [unclassified Neisseria]|uniref:mechanosensitive ion channel family protein n=1 Tax=unclassified Neisseria TaxID=2623750 RepID=UPI0026665119|nr:MULTISPECIES: mechanosensitive ion channel family protein [unclassified Neisseria]MDO1509737.1 mechanosensitive ion channel family protein [Neisseria sp. MVDL19-042950]MDO1515939.1 mechanosensitive ion channel family protein [Neisseria sp. MVDL18-041461]MDO1563052.1 mechanosensitive ion channel family protein [Neisseria sp. MVDL20-010259]
MEIMWETINYYLYNGPVKAEIIESVLMIVGIMLLRGVILQTHFRSHPAMEIEEKRRWVVASRNITLIMAIFGLAIIWAAQIQTLALSMFAVAAAIVLATKELIMCLSGSLLRASTNQYSVGDYIEVAGLRGRVVDINMLNTLMMQVGPNPLVGQLSGKTVSFPNSLLLSSSVQRDNILGMYVIHTFEIPVPVHLDSDEIVPLLQKLVDGLCAPYIPSVERHLEEVQTQKLFITPAAQPRISRVPHDDKTYTVVVRFASPVAKRLEIQQALLDEFIRIQHRLLEETRVQI